MKKSNIIIKVLFFILPLLISGQIKKDTVFFKNTLENKIYFEENINSKIYDEINDFSFTEKSNDCINWVSLQKYEGKYYLYLPCDKGALNKISISKDTVFFKDMEDYNFKIKKFKKSKKNSKYEGTVGNSNIKLKLEIKIIDSINQIAVFKIKNFENNLTHYKLMVNSKNINNFKIIVNECYNEKVKEVDFDNLNLELLFNKY